MVQVEGSSGYPMDMGDDAQRIFHLPEVMLPGKQSSEKPFMSFMLGKERLLKRIDVAKVSSESLLNMIC